ncbi:BCAS2 [Mytilus edulis]|uniref:Pre-mRNA-splicing factor SPF27 n=1 Tax=Mytilus edulis TaxID=6550 RepID=A0A8S3S7G3_MYTED|nr:BCAS2 [Mytilus edulis]
MTNQVLEKPLLLWLMKKPEDTDLQKLSRILTCSNYLQFETEIMKTEYERMQSRLPMDMLNMKRYELPPPPAGKMTDISAWNEAVENSQAQLEHQSLRILNLELLSEYGSNAWKSYNTVLSQMVEQATKQLQELRKKIQEINWQRKNEQTQAGGKLKELEESWVGLVSKNYEIERACVEIEREIEEMEQKRAKKAKDREKLEKWSDVLWKTDLIGVSQ